MKTTLLILAAGMGSRYGGMKQLDLMGPAGETLMDYSVFDALRAGFNKVVFVIRPSFEQEFRDRVVKKLEGHIEVALAFQEVNDVPTPCRLNPMRQKPWGTGHAIWVARQVISEPFAVINADDYYGRESYQMMAAFLQAINQKKVNHYAMCGYELIKTLSTHGSVSRGVCTLDDSHLLKGVQEHTHITMDASGTPQSMVNGEQLRMDPQSMVSMNFWGFHPEFFNLLEEKLIHFMEQQGQELTSEFYIPFVVDELIQEQKATVQVLESKAAWFGITYSEDKARAMDMIKYMVDQKVYPTGLWEQNH